MTKRFFDPSAWPTEQAWTATTARWVTANHTTIATVDRDSPFKDRIGRISQGATNARFARTFDAVDADSGRATFDFVFSFRIGASGDEPRAFARASGAAGSEQAVLFGVVSNQLTIGEYRNPTYSGALGTSSYTLTAGTWYRLRCYGSGTSLLAKIWEEGDDEPASWTVSATATITAAGWIGVGAFNGTTSGYVEYAAIAVGTGGDTPPEWRTRDDWRAWLEEDGAPRAILAELGYMDTATPGTAYLSNCTYSSQAADSPASQPYTAAVVAVPSYSMRTGDAFVGRSTVSVGDLLIDNSDGSRDDWLKANFDGRDATILLGSPDWPRYDFRPMVRATIERVTTRGLGQLVVNLRDRAMLANRAVATATIASGDYAGQLQPAMIGNPLWFEPVATDDATLTYRVNDGAYSAQGTVYDAGLELSQGYEFFGGGGTIDVGADTFTTTADHGLVAGSRVRFPTSAPGGFSTNTDYYVVASGLTTTVFKLASSIGGSAIDITSDPGTVRAVGYGWYEDLAAGTIQLVSRPAGGVRCSATQSGSDFTVAGCIESVLKDRLSLTGYIDDASFDAHAAAWTASVGAFLRERTNALDLFDFLVTSSTLSLYGADRDGLIYLSTLDGSPSSPRMTITKILGGIEKVDELLPIRSIRWGAGRNCSPLAEFADAVSTVDRALWSSSHRKFGLGTVSDGTDSPANHALGILAFEVMTATSSTSTPAVVGAIDEFRSRKAAIFQFDTTLSALELRLGDVVEIEYGRYGFDSGVMGQVIGIEDSLALDKQRVGLTVIVPSYSQAGAPA